MRAAWYIYFKMADGILKADIFFVTTTVAVVAVAAALCWLAISLIRILRDVKDISGRINKESAAVADDFDAMRLQMKQDGIKLRHVFRFLMRWGRRKRRIAERSKLHN